GLQMCNLPDDETQSSPNRPLLKNRPLTHVGFPLSATSIYYRGTSVDSFPSILPGVTHLVKAPRRAPAKGVTLGRAMSFFRYPGGKSKLQDDIVKRLAEANPSGLEYREPFFGGGSVGLKLLADASSSTRIWINDKDVGIACLWTAVIRHHEDLKELVW